jgi:hypothetical protein
MIKIKMTDLGKSDFEMLMLGMKLAEYLTINTSQFDLLPGKGYVGHGPGSRSVQVRYNGKAAGPTNIHEIHVKDSSPNEEKRIARELAEIYKKHSFTEIQ